ncbi:hypothetical protein EC957_001467 [Mortierella hygrophila]|uniref:PH domain-containing protein n=1 Tax=Mortierella hygrophila TaxID=979708 RepID=A0A9P6F5M1_9FUNG|nr:hypothetical protein EC957_001467 [Mortierella hygrophila]
MPVAMPRGDRGNQHWTPRANLESFTTPFPFYSGYLMKLGSNDRWQSRLFTFDGSAPCRTQPYNPNTKWFLHIATITDIRLLPSPKSYYRCFPTLDLPRALFIQTADGRSVTLKSKKNIELERWFFVLTKMWAFQQLLQRTEEDLAATAANAAAYVNLSAAAATASVRVSGGTNAEECSDRRRESGGAGVGGETDPYHQLVLSNDNNHPQQKRNSNSNSHVQQQQQHHNNNSNKNHQRHSSSTPLPPPSSSRAVAPPCTSHLPAHQQSSHLFNNYLQRQQMYFQHQQQQDQGGDYHALYYQQPQSQSQHVGNNKLWRPQRHTAPPVTTIGQESLMRYQIPWQRVSAFFPGGLDWPVQQQQQQYGDEKEVSEDQGVTTAVAISGGGAVMVSIDEEDEKAEHRESGESVHNAYLRKNSLADQFSSPPIPSSNIKNNNASTTTMNGGAGGGRGSGVVCGGELMNIDGSLERQGGGRGGSWHQDPISSIPTTEEVHAGSSTHGLGIHQQATILWPAAGTMEPAKAAAIDMWRRSLMSPLARANTASSFHSDDTDNQALVPASAAKLFMSRNNSRRPSASAGNELFLGPGLTYCCEADADEEDEEDYGNDHLEHQSRPKWFQQQQQRGTYQQPRMAIDAASETDNIPLAVVRAIRQNSIGGAMPLPLPPMDIQMMEPSPMKSRHYVHDEEDEEDDDDEDETGAHGHLTNKHHNLFIRSRHRRRHHHQDKATEPALLHVQRYSRWQKTQLSSEDETGTNRDSSAALTNTPDMSRNSYPTFLATNYNNNRESHLNNLNNCAGRDRDPYATNGGYEANKESLSDPTLNQHHLRSSAEPNLPQPPISPFMSADEFASAVGELPTARQSMAAARPKPAVPTVGILKRPSLPAMDTATLQAAVEASRVMQQREKNISSQSFPSPPERDMTYNNLAHYGNNNYSNVPVHPFAHLPTPHTPPTMSAPSMATTGGTFRASVSGLLPPPPIRPPRRHPVRTSVGSDIKFSPSRRNSQDGSIISGFGGGSLVNGFGCGGGGGLGDAPNNNATGTGSGKVEKSRSLLSFLALNKSTSSSSTAASPKSRTFDFSSPSAHPTPSRRNSLPAVHFLGLNLSMTPPSSTTATSDIKKQRRSSILSLSRLDRSEKKEEKEAAAAAAAALEALKTFQAEVLLIRDPSPPQTPAPASVSKFATSNRRFSLPIGVLSSVPLTPPSASNSPPSLLSSFPPTGTKSTSGSSRPSSPGSSRPSSGYIANPNHTIKRLSSGSLSRPLSRANSNSSLAGNSTSTDHHQSQYKHHQLQQFYQLKHQAPLIQVDAPAPTPVSGKEKEKEKEKEQLQHKGYCRGKNLEVDGCGSSVSGGVGNGYKGRPLTCCSESELIEVLNNNSEEDDDFCYF